MIVDYMVLLRFPIAFKAILIFKRAIKIFDHVLRLPPSIKKYVFYE